MYTRVIFEKMWYFEEDVVYTGENKNGMTFYSCHLFKCNFNDLRLIKITFKVTAFSHSVIFLFITV